MARDAQIIARPANLDRMESVSHVIPLVRHVSEGNLISVLAVHFLWTLSTFLILHATNLVPLVTQILLGNVLGALIIVGSALALQRYAHNVIIGKSFH